jgi:hypothetical protein
VIRDFITELAREVLRGAELDDLQLLFADEMRVLSKRSQTALAHGLSERDTCAWRKCRCGMPGVRLPDF